MRRAWFVTHQMRPGDVLFEWDRPFSLWGYSGSHSQLLFRSVKYDPDTDPDQSPEALGADGDPQADKWSRTRIDLLFKPVDALCLQQLSYRTLRVQVATERITEEVLDRMHRPSGDEQVLELIGPDGVGGHVICLATGFCEDDGEYWEPSPFAADLSDGLVPPWRLRVLGGGPDGDLTARYASEQELVTAIRAGGLTRPTGDKGRWIYVVMAHLHDSRKGESRRSAVAAFLTRHEAEERVQALHNRSDGDRAARVSHWVDAVPIDL